MLIQVLNGLVYGSLLFLLSVGLVLIFGLRGVPNFSHGSFFALGAYCAFAIASHFGFWAGLLAAAAILGLIGLLLDYLVFRPLQNQSPVSSMLVTFGLLLLVGDLIGTIWGKDIRALSEPSLLAGSVDLLGLSFPNYRLALVGLALVTFLALLYWLHFTSTGLFVRACSIDRETTAVQGVHADRLSLLVGGIGCALAGLAGAVSAPLLALSPSMGDAILIDCFVVVVTGGIGSVAGALITSLFIGQVRTFGVAFVPIAASSLPLLVMLCVLVIWPNGLGGRRT